MKCWLFASSLLFGISALLLGCGNSGPDIFTVEPTSETITVNLENGTVTGATPLQALLNGKPISSGVTWTSNDNACLGVDQAGDLTCRTSCGGDGSQLKRSRRGILETVHCGRRHYLPIRVAPDGAITRP